MPRKDGGAMRRAIGVVAGAVFGVVLVANCGAPGGMLGDAGQAIGDAMVTLGDLAGLDLVGVDLASLSVTDAAAAAPMSGSCDKTWNANGLTVHYAEFAVSGFDPMAPQHVTAAICGITATGGSNTYLGKCSPGSTCDAPLVDCHSPVFMAYALGVVRVGCGTSNASYSQKWATAHLKVGP